MSSTSQLPFAVGGGGTEVTPPGGGGVTGGDSDTDHILRIPLAPVTFFKCIGRLLLV